MWKVPNIFKTKFTPYVYVGFKIDKPAKNGQLNA